MARSVDTMTSFATLIDECLTSFYDANPVEAFRRGLFRYAGRLPDVSRVGLERRVEELRAQLARLDSLDAEAMTEEEAFDRDALRAAIEKELFRIAEWNVYALYPIAYLEWLDVSDYLKSWIAPAEERAAALCRFFAGVPRYLDEARENLAPELDRTVLKASLRVFRGYLDFLQGDGDELLTAGAADSEAELTRLQARRQAIESVAEFIAFLERKFEHASDGGFALGPLLFERMLAAGEGVEITANELLERGERERDRLRARLIDTAARIDPSLSPVEVMERIKANHPSGGAVLEETRRLLGELRAFLLERDLVTIPEGSECLVEETPSYYSWAFAMMDGPPSLSEGEFPGIYYVTPPGPGWDEAMAEEWLREFSFAGLRNTSIHEAYPGHFLHALHIRQSPSRVVKTFGAYSSFEAWAHYCEEMMVEVGYGDDELEMIQLGDALLRIVRLIAGVRMHCLGMTVEQARELFECEAYLGSVAAQTEAERGTFDPGYVNYSLGKLLLIKLRRDWQRAHGDSLKEFHDAFLAGGASPVPLVRRRMLPDDSGPIL